ncbi:DNA repair protein RecN [Croceivirga thetidis]|uniref:DNA repair protein RecN n=1 Tax=Croceivirga thetidis TaxID=2721623 RepID=A0ABX1GRJ4_9FLAO|nr:DNA repair protein RecN [Croceivirga thetidis]NKI32558.1 DNA repair protein RecN [Croceivirga thetidis]
MLTQLTIKNYALIEELETSFESGFSTITGETGAGKSILLDALSLVLGKRADSSSLRDKDKKCVVEAEFSIEDYQLKSFFSENELDFEIQTLLRREILPSGKSRAFINDSPVTLNVLSELGGRLVDIHSQHQTLLLTDNQFQMKVLDAYANNGKLLSDFESKLSQFKKEKRELDLLLAQQETAKKELDYNSFLLEELQAANLKPGIQELLEQEYDQLNNVEIILEQLALGNQLSQEENHGILVQILQLKQALTKIAGLNKDYEAILERVNSVTIEFDDIASDLERLGEGVEPDPQRLEQVNSQLSLLHDLLKKHQTTSIEELIEIKRDLEKKVDHSLNIDSKIEAKSNSVANQEEELNKISISIRKARREIIPTLGRSLESELANLGMSAAKFNIELNESPEFRQNGKDDLSFLFAANKGSDFGELKKVASGGELSRIMLVIKSILAEYDKLPTLMFDEIDTGVSGEISGRMGAIMKKMGKSMQVFSITHLPQVAAQGKQQYKVFKEEDSNSTSTYLKLLKEEERITELAEMLGGSQFSATAINHAKELLTSNS